MDYHWALAPAFDPHRTKIRCWSPPDWNPMTDPPAHRTVPYMDLGAESADLAATVAQRMLSGR